MTMARLSECSISKTRIRMRDPEKMGNRPLEKDRFKPNPMTYAPRQVIGCGTTRGLWEAKIYAILSDDWAEDSLPATAMLESAVLQAMETLDAGSDHPLGFAIFHMADDGIYLLLTRFNNANNLRHTVFSVEHDSEFLQITPLKDPHIIACIWEIRLMMFEADAWIETVLKPGQGLTPESTRRYLDRRYNGKKV